MHLQEVIEIYLAYYLFNFPNENILQNFGTISQPIYFDLLKGQNTSGITGQ
jgi:hypothetical protein